MELIRVIADGTGRSPAEVRLIAVWTGAAVIAAGLVTLGHGVVRLVDFLADA